MADTLAETLLIWPLAITFKEIINEQLKIIDKNLAGAFQRKLVGQVEMGDEKATQILMILNRVDKVKNLFQKPKESVTQSSLENNYKSKSLT